MKLGAICLFDGIRIFIPDHISIPLGLRCDQNLTIGLISDRYVKDELIVTPIPQQYWGKVYEFSIPLTHEVGASFAAASALESMGANVLLSESTSMSLISMGFWTGIVTFNYERLQLTEEEFRNRLIEKDSHSETKFIPEKSVGMNPDEQIHLRQLESLSDHLEDKDQIYQGSIFDGKSLILSEKLIDKIIKMHRQGYPFPKYVFLSADLNERLLTITSYSSRQLYHVHLDIEWRSVKHEPIGLYAEITKILAEKGLSILRSYDYILEKEKDFEKSVMRFIVEGEQLDAKDIDEIQEELNKAEKNKIPFVTGGDKLKKVDDYFDIKTPLIFLSSENRQPKCFIARLSSYKEDEGFKQIEDTIKKMGFEPITYEAPPSDGTVFDTIRDTIKKCCCLVNVVTPHDNYRFIDDKTEDGSPCPSPWLIAEEAIARTLGIKVFVIRDEEIERKELTISEGKDRVGNFNLKDLQDVKKACKQLENSIEVWKGTPHYINAVINASRRSIKISRKV
ncbi:hypothetical protein D4S03_05605 [bacterium]|nr:MAG: hypothetical protein D4S03_05605 [bacterium]